MKLPIILLYLSLMGFGQHKTSDTLKIKDSTNVGEKKIEEITIVKKAPLLKRKIDRLEFNIDNSNISDLNAWEILKKTPSVNVIGNDIKIKGSGGILVTINDKKMLMNSDELKTYLENTQGNDIKSIEVITNPPAKYDASGSSIINIVMKKNTLEGYKGVVSGKYVQSSYAKEAFGLSQFYKNKGLSLHANYVFGRGTYFREGIDVVNYVESKQIWKSILNRKDTNNHQHNLSFNAQYDLDSLSNISFNFSTAMSPKSFGIYDVPTQIFNENKVVESFYNTVNDHHSKTFNQDVNLQYEKKFNKKNTLTVTGSFAENRRQKLENVVTNLNFINQNPSQNQFINDNDVKTKLYAFQADYSYEKEKLKFEGGSKYSFVTTRNMLDFSDNENGELLLRPEKGNLFNYKEHNFAAYSSISFDLEKWSFKAGLRTEYTDLEGNSSQENSVNKDHYLKLFPTFYTQYTTENKQQFGFSYGKRISRPQYEYLNPAKSYFNLFSYFQGDSQMKATIIHNLNLTYNYKNWNLDFYYRKEIDPSMEISFQVPETKTLVYHFTNIEKGQAFGLDLSKNFEIKKWWNFNLSATLEHNENFYFGIDKVLYKNKVSSFFTNSSSAFVLNKEKDWNMEIGYRYHSPVIQGTFTISATSSTYFSMNRRFFDKKLKASFIFNDIFRTEGQRVSSKYANQDNYFLDYSDTQNFIFRLQYTFGNQKVEKSKEIQKAEEQSRM